MTIIFHYADGSYRVLRPLKHINPDDIAKLQWDFRAIKYEVR